MEDGIKNKLILILTILSVMLFIGVVSSYSGARSQKANHDREMTKRLEAEEKMGRFSQGMIGLEDELALKAKELEEEKAAHQATKKALIQEQLINQSLKEEAQKVTKPKDTQEDLKEVLAEGQNK